MASRAGYSQAGWKQAWDPRHGPKAGHSCSLCWHIRCFTAGSQSRIFPEECSARLGAGSSGAPPLDSKTGNNQGLLPCAVGNGLLESPLQGSYGSALVASHIAGLRAGIPGAPGGVQHAITLVQRPEARVTQLMPLVAQVSDTF